MTRYFIFLKYINLFQDCLNINRIHVLEAFWHGTMLLILISIFFLFNLNIGTDLDIHYYINANYSHSE